MPGESLSSLPYPEALAAIRDAFTAGRRDDARSTFYRWLPLIRYESQPGSVPGTSDRDQERNPDGAAAGSPTSIVAPPAPDLDQETLDELSELLAAVTR